MASIKAEVNFTISDGCSIAFKAPCDASAVTNLIVYYPNAYGETTSQTFTFKDAHGNNLANIDNLFASGAMIKVVLDTVNSGVYIQNADTNAYLEGMFNLLQKNWGQFTLLASGWSSEATDGYYTQQLTISGMSADYYPTVIPVYSSATAKDDEKSAFGQLDFIETISGAIVAYATEPPTVDIKFNLVGV